MLALTLESWLNVLNILLHSFNIDLVVEVDNVLSFTVSQVYLEVDALDIPLIMAFKNIGILVDHIVKGNRQLWLDLAYTVYRAHDQLVKMSIDHELWLHR